ncbi:MAG: hypothetical protein WC836_24435, partial [Desulfobacula sp.]
MLSFCQENAYWELPACQTTNHHLWSLTIVIVETTRIVAGSSRRSPRRAHSTIREVNNPKYMVGTKLLKLITPNPMNRIREDRIIPL